MRVGDQRALRWFIKCNGLAACRYKKKKGKLDAALYFSNGGEGRIRSRFYVYSLREVKIRT